SDEPLPDKALSDAMFEPDVEAALNTLWPEFRTVIMLCDVEQLSYEQIAEVLGIKIGTVQSRIHRGRAQLRDALAHRGPRADRSRPGGEARGRCSERHEDVVGDRADGLQFFDLVARESELGKHLSGVFA